MITLNDYFENIAQHIEDIPKASQDTSYMARGSYAYFCNGAGQRFLALCNNKKVEFVSSFRASESDLTK